MSNTASGLPSMCQRVTKRYSFAGMTWLSDYRRGRASSGPDLNFLTFCDVNRISHRVATREARLYCRVFTGRHSLADKETRRAKADNATGGRGGGRDDDPGGDFRDLASGWE